MDKRKIQSKLVTYNEYMQIQDHPNFPSTAKLNFKFEEKKAYAVIGSSPFFPNSECFLEDILSDNLFLNAFLNLDRPFAHMDTNNKKQSISVRKSLKLQKYILEQVGKSGIIVQYGIFHSDKSGSEYIFFGDIGKENIGPIRVKVPKRRMFNFPGLENVHNISSVYSIRDFRVKQVSSLYS